MFQKQKPATPYHIIPMYNEYMKPDELETIERIKKEQDIFKKAELIHYLVHEKEIHLTQISKILGTLPSYLSNVLRLLTLPDLVRDSYYSKILSLTHLLILSRLSGEDVIKTYENILSNNLTVQQTEDVVREILYKVKTHGEKLEETTKNQIIAEFKDIDPTANVSIIQTQIQGKIIITLKGNRAKTNDFFEKLERKLQ
jgi:ParB-like chromosome segregation protein Spo0J